MSRIDARVRVVDTEGGRTFIERFDTTPIRIGRAFDCDLRLAPSGDAARHGEIEIGQRSAYFRSRAWLRPSRIDDVRVRRGLAVKLTDESVITLGPMKSRYGFAPAIAATSATEESRRWRSASCGKTGIAVRTRSGRPLVPEARIGDHASAWGGVGAQTSRRFTS